jgi:hypothetical protein
VGVSTAKAGVDETERRRMKKQNTSELWLQYNILLCEIRPKTEHTLFCYGREYRNKLDTFIILSIKKNEVWEPPGPGKILLRPHCPI